MKKVIIIKNQLVDKFIVVMVEFIFNVSENDDAPESPILFSIGYDTIDESYQATAQRNNSVPSLTQ